jgi:3-dehydroquinate synthase
VEPILIGGESELVIGRGLLSAEAVLPEREGRSAVAVIAQPGSAMIGRHVMESLVDSGLRSEVRVVAEGDAAKTIDSALEVYLWLNDLGIGRQDTVLGIGGAACTDLAGFVASTYLRGVEAAYVATTLLAAVDGAIGGKTALNLEGKNLIGTFRHPSRVVIDLDVLDRLPDHLRSDGLSEAAKAGLIGDPELVRLLEDHKRDAPLEEIVERAVAVKVLVVSEDFREEGVRAFLNYGHTVGHAIEASTTMSHGAAVAIGMTVAAEISAKLEGFRDAGRQRALLDGLGLLPAAMPAIDRAEVRRLMGMDKKRDDRGLRMVLLREIGDPVVRHVDNATVEAAFDVLKGALA